MAREQPCARTLRSLDLPPDQVEDITWHNTFRFLDLNAPQPVNAEAVTATEGVTP
jgi:aminocarboxymuconate-semialdehyde decarboxylase